MPKPANLLVVFLLTVSCFPIKAQIIRGVVTDTAHKPLAFATIKIADTKHGLMADLNGKFRIRFNNNSSYITVSHLGYLPKKIDITTIDTGKVLEVILQASDAKLEDVVVSSTSSKLKRILGNAIANRNRNNPDKYDWYRCNIYYKTVVDVIPDSTKKDTSQDVRFLKEINNDRNFFITETYTKRTWERPQKLQEDVMGSRISGFKKAWFTSMVTDVLPFHSYNDFITLNGKDYHNPLSSGYYQRFYFRLEDEVLNNQDTVWVISFKPRKDAENLQGTLYINSNQFAISHLIAQHHDSTLNRTVGIEQQYSFIDGKWFPDQLNYFIHWKNMMGAPIVLTMNGTSLIDSVSYMPEKNFRFDKSHTAKLRKGADELPDSAWQTLRPSSLAAKEQRTYEFMDSVGSKHHFDNITTYADRLADGYFPLGKVDIDLQRLYSYNSYEKSRVGFGLRTSKILSKDFSLGGWFGYGFGDKSLKYGGFAEVYADKYREFKFRVAYQSDLQDPGRLQVHEELDKNFLRRFILGRVDRVKTFSFEVSKKLGYLNTTLGFNTEQVDPQYAYTLDDHGNSLHGFTTKEITLGFRYAYAERMTPIFGKYLSSGSKYPIIYGKIRLGEIENNNNKYIHAIGAIKWQKHLNHIGNEQFLLMAGATFSKRPLPLSKLFAGNGFRNDDQSVYVFGGMQTMLPYQYYSDRFINFYWKHDFDFKFYQLKLSRSFSSSPMLSLGYNMLWGKLQHADAHRSVLFSVPDPAYHEAGMMINRIIRMKFMGMMYFNFNAGYFYHLNGRFDHRQNGRIVFGFSADL